MMLHKSIRSLGAELGVQAMSLYRYFPSKADLVDGLQDTIVDEIDWQPGTEPWLQMVEELARAFRATLASHPRAIPVFSRPAATERTFELIEQVIGVLEHRGVPPSTAVHIFQVVLAFVVGHALWQYTPEGPRDVDDEFDFGLDALLIGIAAKAKSG